jgi:hypothetical protein
MALDFHPGTSPNQAIICYILMVFSFLQEGLLTVVVSILAYFWVYNYPSTAEFLSEEERKFIQFRLKNDSDATFDEKFTWSAVLDAIKDPKVWLYG